jgi:uncharacterized coiled-coil DUF342 family protein
MTPDQLRAEINQLREQQANVNEEALALEEVLAQLKQKRSCLAQHIETELRRLIHDLETGATGD